MNRKEKQSKINDIVRYIAYNVFYNKGDFKFVHAYNKLKGKVYLDHDIHISDRIKSMNGDNVRIYDVLTDDEIDKVLVSANNLLKLYEGILYKKVV